MSDTVMERYEKLEDEQKRWVHEMGQLVLDACAHRDAEWQRVVREVAEQSHRLPEMTACDACDAILRRMEVKP